MQEPAASVNTTPYFSCLDQSVWFDIQIYIWHEADGDNFVVAVDSIHTETWRKCGKDCVNDISLKNQEGSAPCMLLLNLLCT